MISIAICDDQRSDLEHIEFLLTQALAKIQILDQVKILAYDSGVALLEDYIILENIDLIYLDIVIPLMSGFEVAEKIIQHNPNIKIIFLSHYENMVYQSFLYQPFLFIRKSMMESEIEGSIRYYLKEQFHQHICIFQHADGELLVNIKDIMYMTNYKHNLTVVKKGSCFTCRDSIRKRCMELKDYGFIQTHISCLINLRYVKCIKTYEVIMQDGYSITLSRTRKKEVRTAYLHYLQEKY